ncbi:hypothetical protein TNCT_653931 [Trichonephila clavata]|uniref:Uncharacterized protein n=1 Tax=Trichonephila clavata TaxID=2740835 RepID=A0A8X6FDX3_TRICU|nr:hypothetical protein TNCT_653931 [Trichonephila clavata]
MGDKAPNFEQSSSDAQGYLNERFSLLCSLQHSFKTHLASVIKYEADPLVQQDESLMEEGHKSANVFEIGETRNSQLSAQFN